MAESVASAAQEEASSSSPSWSEFLQKKADFAALPVPQDWQGWLSYKLLEWLLYAIEDPWGFTTTLILAVSPLFFVSAILSWKLAKMMEREEAEKKRKARRASAARAAVASSKPSAKQRGHKQQSEHHPKAD